MKQENEIERGASSGPQSPASTGSAAFWDWMMASDYATCRADVQFALMDAWNGAIRSALNEIPGGQICDPQDISDWIGSLLVQIPQPPNDGGAAKQQPTN